MTNPLPQLIPACERVARLCGVEMPSRRVSFGDRPDGMIPHPSCPECATGYRIPDDLYALMLVGWVVEMVVPQVRHRRVEMYYERQTWFVDFMARDNITAALTAACDILDGRGEVG